MGLDQHAEVDGEFEFFRWRNRVDIHEFMEKLYFERGGKGDEMEGLFNCVPVELTSEDIDSLEAQAWFDYPEFCESAREYLEAGDKVTYQSWF